MADPTSGMTAGSVSVEIGGNLTPLESSLAQAEQMVRAFDARLSAGLASRPSIGSAATGINATVDQTSAALARVTAPAAAASAQLDRVAIAGMGASVSAKAMADALAATGGDLSKVTPAMLGLAAAESEVATTTAAATGEIVAQGVAMAETSKFSAGVSREFSVLGAEILRGNFSRIPGSLLVMNERLASSGAGVLTLKNMFGSLGSLAGVVFNPMVLGFLAVTTGLDLLVRHFSDFTGGVGDANAALQKQKELVDQLTSTYPQLGKALKDALGQANSKTPTELVIATQSQIDAAQRQVASLTAQLRASAFDNLTGGGRSGPTNLLAYFPELKAKVQDLVSQFEAGTLSATRMREQLAQLTLDPNLTERAKGLANEFVEIADKIGAATATAQAFTSILEAARAEGGATIGGDFSQLKGAADLVDGLRKLAPDIRSPAQRAIDYYKQNSGLDTTGEGKVELDFVLKQIQAQKDLAASTKAANDAKREAQALAQRVATANDNAAFGAATLGMSAQDRSIAETIRSVYGGQWQSQMNSTLATQLRINAAMSAFKDVTEQASNSFSSTFLSDLRKGDSLISSFADGVVSALDQISSKLISMAIDNLWSNAFGGATAGAGGAPGGIVGAIAGLFGMHKFANGTDYAPGGFAMVGERGPELVNLPAGARVSTASQTAALLGFAANNGAANGNGGFTIHVHIDAKGSELGSEVRIAAAVNNTLRMQLPNLIAQYQANPYRVGYRKGSQ